MDVGLVVGDGWRQAGLVGRRATISEALRGCELQPGEMHSLVYASSIDGCTNMKWMRKAARRWIGGGDGACVERQPTSVADQRTGIVVAKMM